jgi:cytochrome bd ubiquinol oxidase subunit II
MLEGAAFYAPIVAMLIMALSMLAYVILDGYDLGVGILLPQADDQQKDLMLGSIGPFWDANETWLVLGVGMLLVAFPKAHGIILGELYLPVALMLFGLTLRGVAFDFRAKAQVSQRQRWNQAFFSGSLLASFAQGLMLGRWITGFAPGFSAWAFAVWIGVCLIAAYTLIGASWLIIKTQGALQLQAIRWASRSLWFTGLGVAAISIATPLVSDRIYARWFSVENIMMLWPIPVMTIVLLFAISRSLRRLPHRLAQNNEYGTNVPFVAVIGIFMLAFHGLAYSTYPYVVVEKLTIWQAASATESLQIILVGAAVVLPFIALYTAMAYRIFRGKAAPLKY